MINVVIGLGIGFGIALVALIFAWLVLGGLRP